MTIASKRLLIATTFAIRTAARIATAKPPATGLAKRKRENLYPRIEKLDLELPIGDEPRLSDQQIQPLFGNHAVPLIVNIDPVRCTRRLAVDQDTKSHGIPRHGRAHDEMKIASMETKSGPAAGLVQHGPLVPHCPITRERPMIEAQPLWQG